MNFNVLLFQLLLNPNYQPIDDVFHGRRDDKVWIIQLPLSVFSELRVPPLPAEIIYSAGKVRARWLLFLSGWSSPLVLR